MQSGKEGLRWVKILAQRKQIEVVLTEHLAWKWQRMGVKFGTENMINWKSYMWIFNNFQYHTSISTRSKRTQVSKSKLKSSVKDSSLESLKAIREKKCFRHFVIFLSDGWFLSDYPKMQQEMHPVLHDHMLLIPNELFCTSLLKQTRTMDLIGNDKYKQKSPLKKI